MESAAALMRSFYPACQSTSESWADRLLRIGKEIKDLLIPFSHAKVGGDAHQLDVALDITLLKSATVQARRQWVLHEHGWEPHEAKPNAGNGAPSMLTLIKTFCGTIGQITV